MGGMLLVGLKIVMFIKSYTLNNGIPLWSRSAPGHKRLQVAVA